MNEKCKYCSYLKQCPDIVEYNSIYCLCYKRIPKDRNMSYEQLQNNWNELKNCVIDLFNRSQDIVYLDVLEKMKKLENGNNGI